MFKLNSDQIQSLIRSLLKYGGGALSANGFNQSSVTQMVTGVASTLIALIWSHFTHADNPTPPASTSAQASGPGSAGKAILGVLAIGLVAGTLIGCKTPQLESGGAYAPLTNSVATVTNSDGTVTSTNVVIAASEPDYEFYVADAAYQLAWNTVNAAFEFERNNRATLWKISPNIKHDLDKIWPTADQVNADYLTARAVYMANPVPANLSSLQQVLAKLQQVGAAATALLPQSQSKGN